MKQIKLNKIILSCLLASVIALTSGELKAAQEPQPIASDSRIKVYTFRPDTVYSYTGHYGYQSRIDLDPTEDILSISMGDSTRWMLQPVGHRIFLKPIEFDATTNMTIITDKRIYYFELYASEAEGIDDEDLVFAARFVYSSDTGNNTKQQGFYEFDYEDDNPEVPDPKKNFNALNFNYSITGARSISPLEVFDDGEFTYMKFPDINADLPAVFQVMPDGNEALINFRIREGYMVVEMATSQFTLRYGAEVACIFNESRPLQKVEPKEDPNEVNFFGIF
jgi:type IV secretion system protein VirB9